MEERIRKAFEAINNLGTVLKVSITSQYLRLKLDELRLTHEYEEKRHEEQEEQRRIREQMREEEKAQREIEKAREEAEREEARSEKALEKARAEAAKATGEQLQMLNEKIRLLEGQLEEAHNQKDRAISRAQLTKSGHVYVISNIGSFGENVYKVGMTRRWDPQERIKELGDASVPFPFDVHAMIYSENAPELEATLQVLFNEKRVNQSNTRKEFFEVALEEIERIAVERGLKVEFTKLAEAKEYRETIALRQQKSAPVAAEVDKFPATLFDNAMASTS
jgi:multidrug efflux pump subunit AcrA (membrane-fusion protein)